VNDADDECMIGYSRTRIASRPRAPHAAPVFEMGHHHESFLDGTPIYIFNNPPFLLFR
jgi:hypothetical protein